MNCVQGEGVGVAYRVRVEFIPAWFVLANALPFSPQWINNILKILVKYQLL